MPVRTCDLWMECYMRMLLIPMHTHSIGSCDLIGRRGVFFLDDRCMIEHVEIFSYGHCQKSLPCILDFNGRRHPSILPHEH